MEGGLRAPNVLDNLIHRREYDLNYTWGMNTHGQRMGGPILPEMMRWH